MDVAMYFLLSRLVSSLHHCDRMYVYSFQSTAAPLHH